MTYTPLVVRDGNNAAQSMGALQDLSGVSYSQVGMDSTQQTYRCSASFTPQATAGVTLISITGSATKTVRIKRIMLSGTATALSNTRFQLVRTSALGAGGTTVSPTIGKNDTNSAAATAVVSHYTTTLKAAGTPVAILSTWIQFQSTVTTPTVAQLEAQMVYPERGVVIGQSLVLRGVSDFLEIQNINAGNLAAGSILDYVVEWVEDGS